MKSQQNYLVLHRTEWDRLQRKHSPKTTDHNREQYFKNLTEQSQNWMKLWPDTVQGHVYQFKKQMKTKQDKLAETLKTFSLNKNPENATEAIIKAKESIFEDSCYGRQLLSALLESKTLEERDLQVKFQNELKTQANIQKLNGPNATSLLDSKQMEINEMTNKLRSTHNVKDIAKYNKAMVKIKQEKRLKEKEDNKIVPDGNSIAQVVKRDAEVKSNRLSLDKQEIKDFDLENKYIKDSRVRREKQEEKIREIWKKYQEKISCKEKIVLNKLHHERCNSIQISKIYNTIKDFEKQKIKQYDEFVQKGVERWLDRTKQQEQKEIEDRISRRKQRKLIDEENKILIELQNITRERENSKSMCCRQCILTKSCVQTKQNMNAEKRDRKQSSFISPKIKHRVRKKRLIEPTPWTALYSTHAQFYQHARDNLQECTYKHTAKKVIDDYTRINCIEPKSLSILN